MGISRKWTIFFVLAVVIIGFVVYGFNSLNDYKRSGELNLEGLKAKVRVVRDEKGMPYIFAENEDDVFFAQGFVAAQDRLFSMELVKRIVSGRLSETFGEKALKSDVKMRTIGFYRNAVRHAEILGARDRNRMQNYVNGVNAYLESQASTIHLKLKLAGIKPEKWVVADSLAIMYYMGWGSSANLGDEVISQMLIEKLGVKKALEIFPLNFNPEDPSGKALENRFDAAKSLGISLSELSKLMPGDNESKLKLGSNNWVVSAKLSAGDKPILANDPHLDARIMPGPFYPVGLITPDFRAVGVIVAGLPGMVVGRTEHIATGVTNGYGDIQDLYVETIDPDNPDHYLEGSRSIPFVIIEEKFKINDKQAEAGFREETVKIRHTKRGPLVSGIMDDLNSDKVFSLRWSPFESMGESVGLLDLVSVRNVAEARNALSHISAIMLNFVVADNEGNIAWQTTGKIPIRSQGDGSVPYVVRDGRDNWQGWIPWQEMPHSINPEKGWEGTCNHTTITRTYPYYFTSHFSPSWRQRRLIELLSQPGEKTADDHWAYQRDTMNLMAKRVVPVLVESLKSSREIEYLGRILDDWNFHDDPDQIAPSVFQILFREFMLETYRDELGEKLAVTLGTNWYYWQERLVAMMADENNPWFDDTRTGGVKENLRDIILRAGATAEKELVERFGENPDEWLWGELHRMEYLSAIRRSGFGKSIVGGGSHAMPGSGETLHRGLYSFDNPYDPSVTASLRMVADLSDPDKIMAVIPSGVSGRLFDPHRVDQIRAFMDGGKLYWWFSDQAIAEHTQSELTLLPAE